MREQKGIIMKKLAVGAIAAVTIGLGLAGPAFAGEITGNGKPTQGPSHASSECAFSGLEDGTALDFSTNPPTPISVPGGPGYTQTPAGETATGLRYPPGVAGQACRGNLGG